MSDERNAIHNAVALHLIAAASCVGCLRALYEDGSLPDCTTGLVKQALDEYDKAVRKHAEAVSHVTTTEH